MKEAYRVALIVLLITETMMSVLLLLSITSIDDFRFSTSQYAIEAYRDKSTIYDCIPGGALVGFAMKVLHSPLGALVATIQGGAMGYVLPVFGRSIYLRMSSDSSTDLCKTSEVVLSIAPMKISTMNKWWTGFSTESECWSVRDSVHSLIAFPPNLEMLNCGVLISMSYLQRMSHQKKIKAGVSVGLNRRWMWFLFFVFLSTWQIHFLCRKISTQKKNSASALLTLIQSRWSSLHRDDQSSCHPRAECNNVVRWTAANQIKWKVAF